MSITPEKAIFMRFSEPNHVLQNYICTNIPKKRLALKLKGYGRCKNSPCIDPAPIFEKDQAEAGLTPRFGLLFSADYCA